MFKGKIHEWNHSIWIMTKMCFQECNYSSTNSFYICPIIQTTAAGPCLQFCPTSSKFLKTNNTDHRIQDCHSAEIRLQARNSLFDSHHNSGGLILELFFSTLQWTFFMNYVIYFWSFLEILQICDTCTCRNPSRACIACLWPLDLLHNLSSNLHPQHYVCIICVCVFSSVNKLQLCGSD